MHKLALAIQWREDVASGEMIQTPDYNRGYLAFERGVSWLELEAICIAINTYYSAMSSNLRVMHGGRKLRPWLSGT